MRKLVIVFVLLFAVNFGFSQKKKNKNESSEIFFIAPQMANEELFIAYHYGKKQFVSDTLTFDEKGIALLKQDEPLVKGIYLAVFPKLNNKYFEFIVSEQQFSIELTDTNKMNQPKFSGSFENELFYSDINKMNQVRLESDQLKQQIQSASGQQKEQLESRLKKINDDFMDYRLQLIDKHPDAFYVDMLNLMREIDIPDAPKGLGQKEADVYRFNYYKSHYWDYVDFAEEGILRTPIYQGKLMDYINRLTVKHPDSIIISCDEVIERASKNEKVYQYTLVTLLNKYANSKVMGDDGIYVHLVKNYYAYPEKTSWVDDKSREKMVERWHALEPLLIDKIAPDLTLRDTTIKQMFRLHDLPFDFTILYIWDHDCGHCKEATPKLVKFFNDHRNESLMVYAVSTTNINEIDKWKAYIKKNKLNWINVADLYHQTDFRDKYDLNSTPQVYVLDKDKRIIAKRIGIEQLEGFFHNYLKNQKDERYTHFEFNDNLDLSEPEEH